MVCENMPDISVIVPVYNAEKYLHRCIDSILAQTYIDFELLLINDGSKDNSGAICDEYAAKDARVRVFHKENGGVSSARNCGLDNATGKYICFIDSDDWVDANYLEELIPNEGEDMVVCAFMYDTMETFPLSDIVRDKQNIESVLHILLDHMAVCSPWSKILCRDIIERNHIRFDTKVCAGEDMLFICDYFSSGINKIRTISFPLYHYYITDNASLSHRIVDLKTTEYVLDCIKERFDNLSKVYKWNSDEGYKRHITTQFNNFLTCIKCVPSFFKRVQLIKRVIDNRHVRLLLSDIDYILKRTGQSGVKAFSLRAAMLPLKLYYLINNINV
ncbi:MAG: glycosyltransferase family 2 protein [Bacteroidaceae bacterium]|nr:glycosyltransferase family 2 protein [Bacteroidaceae bacterium]